MTQEKIQCQNCKQEFEITSEDEMFYRKIDVPPPTFCPECRMIRRMLWRNARNLYKHKCDAPDHKEDVISIYPPEKKLVVYDQSYWWAEQYDPLKYGRPYDFSIPFFVQFADLFKKTPLPNLSNVNAVNSEYTNMTIDSKNCYLVFSASQNEDCSYAEGINGCRDSMDVFGTIKCEKLYSSVDCQNCFHVLFSSKAILCSDAMFLFDCKNCSNCIGCWGLRNKQYCIFNEQYTKENYFDKAKSFHLESYRGLQNFASIFNQKSSGAIHRFAEIYHSKGVTGDRIESCNNCHYSFDIFGVEDSKYVWRLLESGGSDNYDITIATKPTLSYEGQGVGMGHESKFSLGSGDVSFSSYTHSCISGCSHLFGCVGLTRKSYCILNKQYTKDEYEMLVPKIIQHMNDMPYVDKNGIVYKYGEFFPSDLSPFGYNETLAQEYFPLTKEEVLKRGYKWRDIEEKNYHPTLQSNKLPDCIENVEDSIIDEIIGCDSIFDPKVSGCSTAFRIIPQELEFYRRMNLPLPRLCPNCRHYERLSQRNPLKLWHRKCMKEGCSNEFETSYSPERPEIVYCESCYQREVI